MDGIVITLSNLTETASKIRVINGRLNATLEEMRQIMNSLESQWQSDASTTIRDRFNSLSSRFVQYYDVIESYAAFLDLTKDHYEATENTLQGNAESFV